MILACHKIEKSFGTNVVLDQASFHIEEKEKAAVVGVNGAGKSTLLKIIMQEEDADSGEVILAKGSTIGYLSQHQELNGEKGIYEELLEEKRELFDIEQKLRFTEEKMKHAKGKQLSELLDAYTRLNQKFEYENGYACKSEITGVLKGLGFEESEFDKTIGMLSGGQKTRVALGKLLLSKPDILLLDEPTNHLDMRSVTWLENFLGNYDGAVLLVSHDRYFLNRVVTKVVEIAEGKLTVFSGNYSEYSKKKAKLREARIRRYINQQREVKHQEEVIAKLKQFNREKSVRRAQSREKMLDKMEMIEKPTEREDRMKLMLEPNIISGKDVLKVRNLSKSYPSNELLYNVSIDIQRGEKVAVIGDNGTGKTTFLKIINQMEEADCGEFELGTKVHIGYYDQEQQILHTEKTLFEEVADAYPDLNHTKIRNLLAAFLFTGDEVFKKVDVLSGGERGRLSLAKLMLSEANFLILDEPTNHLDIVSKEILEQALKQYSGTVLYVSHDRYFINETATRILDLQNHNFVSYIGNYDYYLEKKEQLVKRDSQEKQTEAKEASAQEPDAKSDWMQQKELQARKRKLENDIKRTEQLIEQNEERISQIDELLLREEIYTDGVKCSELTQEKENLENALEELYEQWEQMAQTQ